MAQLLLINYTKAAERTITSGGWETVNGSGLIGEKTLTTERHNMGKFLQATICGVALLFACQAVGNECLNLLPDDAVVDGLPKVCQSSYNGMNNQYSCQDYRSGELQYRVLYKGGLHPKAVLQLNSDSSFHLLSAPLFGNPKLHCPLRPPAGIPEYAIHRGTGICYDDDDRQVACSVFEYAPARQTVRQRYMTFYGADERQPVSIDAHVAGSNEDAMVAEIAFQIGMNLWDSECCAEQAVEYLAYAYQLFPRTEAYLKAYRHSRATLAIQELSSGRAN